VSRGPRTLARGASRRQPSGREGSADASDDVGTPARASPDREPRSRRRRSRRGRRQPPGPLRRPTRAPSGTPPVPVPRDVRNDDAPLDGKRARLRRCRWHRAPDRCPDVAGRRAGGAGGGPCERRPCGRGRGDPRRIGRRHGAAAGPADQGTARGRLPSVPRLPHVVASVRGGCGGGRRAIRPTGQRDVTSWLDPRIEGGRRRPERPGAAGAPGGHAAAAVGAAATTAGSAVPVAGSAPTAAGPACAALSRGRRSPIPDRRGRSTTNGQRTGGRLRSRWRRRTAGRRAPAG
jgi:hypothetical protein